MNRAVITSACLTPVFRSVGALSWVIGFGRAAAMHSQRAQRVPTTGLALALVHREVVLALVRLLERPSAASRFSSTIAIRFGDAIVGLRAGARR